MAIHAPKHLKKESRILFHELVDIHALSGDSEALQKLTTTLEAKDRLTKARTQIDMDGMILIDKFGQKKSHPLLSIERDSRAAFLSGLKSLNFNSENVKNRGPGRVSSHDEFLLKLKRNKRKGGQK